MKKPPFQADRERNAMKATNEEKFASPNDSDSNSWGSEADEVDEEGRISPSPSEGTSEQWECHHFGGIVLIWQCK